MGTSAPQGWTHEQNIELEELVRTHGAKWTLIGSKLGRTSYVCRAAYKRLLEKSADKNRSMPRSNLQGGMKVPRLLGYGSSPSSSTSEEEIPVVEDSQIDRFNPSYFDGEEQITEEEIKNEIEDTSIYDLAFFATNRLADALMHR
jgi:hypothetical protein